MVRSKANNGRNSCYWCAGMIALRTRSMIRKDNLPMTCLMSCIFLQVFNKGVQVPITHNPSWKTKKTIKNSLFTVLQENPLKWPSIIEEVVFANRVSKHSFTKEFPFQVTTQSRTSITSRCKNISFHLQNIRFLTSLLKRASLAICCPLLEAVMNIQNQKIFTSTMRYY